MAVALFRGPAHICVAVDDELARWSGREVVGLPAREAFVGFPKSQAAMDRVYASGIPECLDCPNVDGEAGRVCMFPVIRSGVPVGVATEWAPILASSPQRTPLAPATSAGQRAS